MILTEEDLLPARLDALEQLAAFLNVAPPGRKFLCRGRKGRAFRLELVARIARHTAGHWSRAAAEARMPRRDQRHLGPPSRR